MIFNFIVSALKLIGTIGASAASVGCWILLYDEPEAPKSIIEK